MKKLVITIVMAVMLIVPTCVFAEKIDLSKYNTMNLEETLKDEQSNDAEFTYDINGYSENDQQVTIYLFKRKGCPHCEDFLSYVGNDLVQNYGQYFKIVSFEVWNDKNNSQLLNKVASFLVSDGESYGVPFIVIGDQYFSGYGTDLNSEIEDAIMDLYNSKDRYDVFEEINKEEKKANGTSSAAVIIWNIIITTVGVLIVIAHNTYTKNEIIAALGKKAK